MIFADSSINSQPIVLKFYKHYFQMMRRKSWKYDGKIFYKPISFVFELYHMSKV